MDEKAKIQPKKRYPWEDIPDNSFLESLLCKAKIELLRIEESKPPPTPPRPILIIHAGAEDECAIDRLNDIKIVRSSAIEGYKLLRKGADAVDVVEFVLRKLESYYFQKCNKNDISDFETDAAILEDDNFKLGCIGAIGNYKHPISLAKHVMQNTDHALIVGSGADILADEIKDKVDRFDDDDSFIFDDEKSEQDSLKGKSDSKKNIKSQVSIEGQKIDEYKIKTFGACIYDSSKHFSSGTVVYRTESKDFGRLSATGTLVGCGIASKPSCGCVSVSGTDKLLYTKVPARNIIEKMETYDDMKKCLKCEINELKESTKERNFGAIAIDKDGMPFVYFTAESFPWAYCAANDILFYGAEKKEYKCEKIYLTETGYCEKLGEIQDTMESRKFCMSTLEEQEIESND